MENTAAAIRRKRLKNFVYIPLALLLSVVLRVVGVYTFILPANFAPGGVTGIAAMLQHVTTLSSGYFIFALNVPLIILAFIYLGRSYAIQSAVCTIMVSGLLILMENVKAFEVLIFVTDQPILSAIAGGILSGASLAIMLKTGGSTGGTDIIAALIYRKFSATKVEWLVLACDVVIVTVSLFVYSSLESVLLAAASMFVSSKTTQVINSGFASALKAEIITDAPEELSKIIMEKLNRGVTVVTASGAFSGTEKKLLICVIRKRQLTALKAIVAEHSKSAFAYITMTSEVVGRGFTAAQ